MTTARVYHPEIQVVLHKTIRRQQIADGAPVSARFKSSAAVIDLTPYLADGGSSVRTSKSVRDPAGGFSITLGDVPNQSLMGFESIYALVEPMDFIEIRMRHGDGRDNSPLSAIQAKPPIVMRGFVSSVGRNEGISADGRASRTVTISGQDYGKLWQMLQILYLPGYVVGEDTLTNFRLFEKFGVGFETGLSGEKFLKEVITKILNPYLKNLMPKDGPNPSEVKLDRVTAKQGSTSLGAAQNTEGTIYNLLQTCLDVGIWNELYLEDEEDGVYCVFRPNPYKTVAGKKIQSDAPDVPSVDLPGDDVLSMALERTDANIANYYWVRAPRFDLNTELFRKQFAVTGSERETVLLDKYQNSDSKLYGIRVMFVDTQMGATDLKEHTSGLPKAQQDKREGNVNDWVNDRRRILVEQNKDNVVLERGMMRVRGNEKIRAGSYVKLRRGGFSAEYYVVQVAHEFIAFQGFFTTLIVERGLGFAERSKREGGAASPYLSEMRDL